MIMKPGHVRLLSPVIAMLLTAAAPATFGQTASGASAKTGVHEAGYLKIGGIEQWTTIDGADADNPVILFLHGGPGSTLTPFAKTLFGSWADDFVLVHWDQRGAGRTHGRNAPEELTEEYILSNPLTLGRMVQDGIELATHLKSRFGDRKIILFATSWGSVLGVDMIRQKPELFHAYVAHSQIVNPREDLPVSDGAATRPALARDQEV